MALWCLPRVADSTILERLGAEIKEMGEGYHFITARVDGGALPADTVRPGRKCAASLPPPRLRPALRLSSDPRSNITAGIPPPSLLPSALVLAHSARLVPRQIHGPRGASQEGLWCAGGRLRIRRGVLLIRGCSHTCPRL